MQRSLIVLAALLMAGCQYRPCTEYKSVEPEGWETTQALHWEAAREGEPYHTLHVRTTSRYPYQELALEVRIVLQEAQGDSVEAVVQRDTIVVPIERTTGPHFGHSCAPLPYPTSLPLTIHHVMSDMMLEGVCEVGVE